MSFALALAPLRKGYGPTAILEGRDDKGSSLTLDTRTLARIDFANPTPIELTAAQADTTFAVGFAPFVPLDSVSYSVILPDPSTCIGKTFRFEVRASPPASGTLRIERPGIVLRAVLSAPSGDSSRTGVFVDIFSGAQGSWIEVYALSATCFAVRGVISSLGVVEIGP
jgi:hypothetical protein